MPQTKCISLFFSRFFSVVRTETPLPRKGPRTGLPPIMAAPRLNIVLWRDLCIVAELQAHRRFLPHNIPRIDYGTAAIRSGLSTGKNLEKPTGHGNRLVAATV